jgi:hypothetical protein
MMTIVILALKKNTSMIALAILAKKEIFIGT